ncbi:MAG TPA: alpha/beta fold hydrolase [Acidimicrobiia bacterium]|jgi:2-succinyl-6-hydroxy-2,4-cyclohexadiene-1-carboxylate synthase
MPVLFVPGFTQTPSSWDGVRAHLSMLDERDTVALAVPERDSFATTVDALVERGGAGVWCGYSMGGRLALALALAHPNVVQALVLVSAMPGIADDQEGRARVEADEQLARTIERDGTAAFLERWLAQPMFADVPADAPGVHDRAAATPAALAHSVRTLGTGSMPSMWDRLGELRMPVLVVTGNADAKFTEIGDAMAAQIPDARRVQLACGHAVPLVRPAELAAALHDFTKPAASSSDTTS